MRIFIAAVSVLVASGCVMTPAQLAQEGPRSEPPLLLAPAQAAACVARNAEAFSDAMRPDVRPAAQAGGFDVVIRIAGDVATFGTVALVELRPANPTSRAVVYRHPHAAESPMFDKLLKGC